MQIRMNTLTPELFLDMYQSVGWEPPGLEQVATALSNTLVAFTCYDQDRPVGMVRLIGDGGMSFYIKDFAVIPAYQRRGAGKLLMAAVEQYVKECKPFRGTILLVGWSGNVHDDPIKTIEVQYYDWKDCKCSCG